MAGYLLEFCLGLVPFVTVQKTGSDTLLDDMNMKVKKNK